MILKENDFFEESLTISEKLYQGFIDLFKDNNPLHTDESFAKEAGFSISADDLDQQPQPRELSKGELEGVVGGTGSTNRVLVVAGEC